ncbi:MAG: type II secretion system F family protein [Planctomycetota bacterium]
MDLILLIAAFVTCASLVGLVAVVSTSLKSRLTARLEELRRSEEDAVSGSRLVGRLMDDVIPRLGVPLIPGSVEDQDRLRTQLIRAGFYREQAPLIFLGTKMLLLAIPAVIVPVCWVMGVLPSWLAMLLGVLAGSAAFLLPDYWLKWCEARRQTEIRRTLPDALDMIVVCADAGLSLDAGIQRVGYELRLAHPLLSSELRVVSRSMELGMSAPDALAQLSARFEIPELRYLATIVREAERFGSSVAKSIRLHAETLRVERIQRAEEAARKSAVKMLFPTILFIFPVLLLVVLVPSILQIQRVLGEVIRRG